LVVSTASSEILVIGAGVSGLSTALALLQSGLAVTVYAADPPLRTTSAAAGALWGPHLVGADERVGRWAAVTLARFRALAADPATGIRETAGVAASLTEDAGKRPPDFAIGAGALTRCDPAALPRGYASGWRYTAPLVAMPTYLDYLVDEVLRAGGRLHLGGPLRTLAEAERQFAAPVIVNCAGFGASELVPDATVTPVRGQILVVANPGLTEFFVGEQERPEEITYFFPHGSTAVLGGTHQHANASSRPDPADARRIMRDCAAVEPRLARAHVLTERVGLRPVRPSVRLEAQAAGAGRYLVHNYGHGGAGVTLSWGCALAVQDEVIRLLG
jgi:D-amino-acid oxidase